MAVPSASDALPGPLARPRRERPQSVLFMCGQNVVRSPMAAVLAHHLFGRSLYVGSAGVMIANPHVFTLEDGSRHKRAEADQLGFKREVDPMGLLNPGKMRSFVPAAGA